MSHSKVITLIVFFHILCLFPFCPADCEADNSKEEYNAVQKEIRNKKDQLAKAKKNEQRALSEIDETNKELRQVSRELQGYKQKIKGTVRRARTVEVEIAALTDKIDERKGWLMKKLRTMHRYGRHGDVILVVSSSENFSQALRRWRYLEALSAHERIAIENLLTDMAALKSKEKDIKKLHSKLEENKKKIENTEELLKKEKQKKHVILASVRRKRNVYQKMLRDLDETSRKLQQIIKESEMGPSQYDGSDFRGLKGHLPWPVIGKIAVKYGAQEDPTFKTPVFRNGIYIEADDASIVRSSHKGKVVYAEWFKGYGQLVIVNHGSGYHSLYGNLSEIFLKSGDIINERAEIGKVGTSGLLARPSLYFEIRYKGKPLDPAQWLNR